MWVHHYYNINLRKRANLLGNFPRFFGGSGWNTFVIFCFLNIYCVGRTLCLSHRTRSRYQSENMPPDFAVLIFNVVINLWSQLFFGCADYSQQDSQEFLCCLLDGYAFLHVDVSFAYLRVSLLLVGCTRTLIVLKGSSCAQLRYLSSSCVRVANSCSRSSRAPYPQTLPKPSVPGASTGLVRAKCARSNFASH